LNDNELRKLFSWIKHHEKTGLIVNDLQRNRLAYYSAKYITRLLNGSLMAQNDGPISVLRGFKKEELTELLQNAQIAKYSITWKWIFRYLVVVQNNS
jgi:hypothetical protein